MEVEGKCLGVFGFGVIDGYFSLSFIHTFSLFYFIFVKLFSG